MPRRSKSLTATPLAPLTLPAELTIYTVGELHPLWLAWLAQAAASTDDVAPVEAAAVDEVDAAGVQLLLSLERALGERGRRLRIGAPSAALETGCGALGLSGWLQAQRGAEAST